MTELERVIEFAKSKSVLFDSIYYECEWNEYRVYSRSFEVSGDFYIGLPVYILLDKQNNIRLADSEEVFEILETLPDDYTSEPVEECDQLDGDFPRFLLTPFEAIRPDDPRYETALTREELVEEAEKEKNAE